MGKSLSNQDHALGLADSMMTIANDAALSAAAMEVAPAIMIKYLFALSTGNPLTINKAGEDWRAGAKDVGAAADALRLAVSEVSPADWSAGDRDAYESRVDDACQQLGVVRNYLEAAGVALSVQAYALLIYAYFAMMMGLCLFAIGLAIIGCEVGVVSAVAVPELEAAAAICLTVTSVATGVLASVGDAVADVLQVGAGLDAAAESSEGNTTAWADLENGEKVGAAAASANLLQNGMNAGLDYANRNAGLTGRAKEIDADRKRLGLKGKDAPKDGTTDVGAVDLDADRDWAHTWTVGAAGSYKDVSAGAHVYYGNDGIDGGDVKAGYTPSKGAQLGAEGSYKHDPSGGWDASGKVTGGYKLADGQTVGGVASGDVKRDADGGRQVSAGATGTYDDGHKNTAQAGTTVTAGTDAHGGTHVRADASADYQTPVKTGEGVTASAGANQDADGGTETWAGARRDPDGDPTAHDPGDDKDDKDKDKKPPESGYVVRGADGGVSARRDAPWPPPPPE